MNKHRSRTIAALTLMVGLFTLLGSTGPVFAAPATSTSNGLNTLKISPVRSDIVIAPGKTDVVTMKVTNMTKAPMTIQAIENDFVAGDDRGTPALILDASKFAPTHSLKRYMVPIPNTTIAPGVTQEIKVTVKVPLDAKPGGYYGAVRFSPVSAGGSTSVNLNASAASLILMTVPGPVEEKLTLKSFDVKQGSKVDTIFQSANDLQVSFRMENTGSIQEGPFGNISVMQGDKVVYSYNFNDTAPREMVLPDSTRVWDVPLKNIGGFGNYTIKATLSYGQKNQTIEVKKSFWVIPIAVIAVTVGGLLLLVAIIVAIRMFLQDYKKRILKKHGRK